MEVKKVMSKDFTAGYNEAIKDILAKRGMWAGANPELLKKLEEESMDRPDWLFESTR